MTTFRISAAAAAVLLCASTAAFAQTERELDAHEHGAAALDIVLDGAYLYLDLRTPAANVLGFEHAPSTPEQREAVEAARAVLESNEPFVPDATGGCTLDSAEADIALADEDGHDEDHDAHGDEHGEDEDHDAHGDDEDHDAHGDEHGGDEDHDAHGDEHGGDEDHDAHGDEHGKDEDHDAHVDEDGRDEGHDAHGGEDGHDDVHSEIEASYAFLCDAPEELDGVATTLFERFAGFDDIDVQLVGPGGQTALELTPERPRVSFEAVR